MKKGGFLAHRSLSRSEDETEIRAGEGTGGKGRERHPAGDTPAILGRREDPHCAGGPARRGEHRRAVPSRGDRPESVLPLVERLPWGREEAARRRYGPRSNLGRGEGPASRGQRAERGRGRTDARKPVCSKKA